MRSVITMAILFVLSSTAFANHTYYDMSDPNSVTVYQNNTYGNTTQVVTTGNNLDDPSIINPMTRDGGE